MKGYIFNYFEQRNWIARKKERRRGGKVEDENKKEKRLRRKGKGQKRGKKKVILRWLGWPISFYVRLKFILVYIERMRKREGAKGLNRILFGSLTLKT